MIRDLVDISIDMIREERLDEVASAPSPRRGARARSADAAAAGKQRQRGAHAEKLRERLKAGKLDEPWLKSTSKSEPDS